MQHMRVYCILYIRNSHAFQKLTSCDFAILMPSPQPLWTFRCFHTFFLHWFSTNAEVGLALTVAEMVGHSWQQLPTGLAGARELELQRGCSS